MPRKVREVQADYLRAGFTLLRGRGKGSHRRFKHPLVAEIFTLAGNAGADARPYNEADLRRALAALAEAERRNQEGGR